MVLPLQSTNKNKLVFAFQTMCKFYGVILILRRNTIPYSVIAFFGPIVLLLLMILNFLGLFYLPVVFIAIAAVGIKERDNVCNYIEFPVQAYLLWKVRTHIPCVFYYKPFVDIFKDTTWGYF